MKILKYACCILLLLFGADFFFVGAAGSWECMASGQPAGLVLMLPMAAGGVGLIWLGVRLLRGHPVQKTQEPVLSEQEKAAKRKAEEDARRKENEAAAEQWRQEEQRWLEEHPDVRCAMRALCHRVLYLRLKSEHQLTMLGDRKDALLERCREENIHLVLQPSRNEIVDLTYGRVYALSAGASGYNPLIDEVVRSEVNLVPVDVSHFP